MMNHAMMRLLSIVCLCLISACSTRPPAPEPDVAGRYRNACLPEAAMMAQALRGKDIAARVLLITTPAWSHAVTVYLYPSGANRLWAWDEDWKSIRVRALWDNPEQIARTWISATKRDLPVTKAEFL